MPAERSGADEAEWRRSRFCVGDGHCVEVSVAAGGAQVRMRNSTAPETVLVFDADDWGEFLDAIKDGQVPLAH
jgi:hypothetical protein